MIISRVLFLMLSICVFMTSLPASASSGLKEAFDEFNFALSVEWDQKDQAFYDKKVKELEEKIRTLQSKGLTNSDLLQMVLSETKSESLRKELSLLFTKIEINKMSQSEAMKVVNEAIKKSYSQGASWNGEVVFMALIGILIVAWTVAYINCIKDPNHVTVCTEEYVCTYSYEYGDDCSYESSCGCRH